MAKATRVTKDVTRTIVDKVPDGVNLHLTEKEASILYGLVGKITGPFNGPRGALTEMYYTLQGLGITAEKLNIDNIWIESQK